MVSAKVNKNLRNNGKGKECINEHETVRKKKGNRNSVFEGYLNLHNIIFSIYHQVTNVTGTHVTSSIQ